MASSQTAEPDVNCVICLEVLKPTVRRFPCFHNACQDCLKEYLKSNTHDPKCPKCQESINMGEGGVDSLALNRFLQVYIEKYVTGPLQCLTGPLEYSVAESTRSSDLSESTLPADSRIRSGLSRRALSLEMLTRIYDAGERAKNAAEDVQKLALEMKASLET
ncbi:uncharacterized protein LOC143450001 [Clavelina lepadiformis]|uniref:RING-type domain-containing protein n=1 Tax=Clavelina lepadiformis TaxID=159417 RepID=A0ABP0GHJ7_CLALP